VSQVHYGTPLPHPGNADFITFTNEQFGLNANLTAAANVLAFALPYPSSMDLASQSLILWSLEFLFITRAADDAQNTHPMLQAYVGVADRRFGATFGGDLTDVDDEAMKAQMEGPMNFGMQGNHSITTAAIDGVRMNDRSTAAIFNPKFPLDLFFPLRVQLVNNANTWTLLTSDGTPADFTSIDQVMLRMWYTTRQLSPQEMGFRGAAARLARIEN